MVGRTPGLQPTPSSACLVWMELNSLATGGPRGTRADLGPPHNFYPKWRTEFCTANIPPICDRLYRRSIE
jgi:hypothetical protein